MPVALQHIMKSFAFSAIVTGIGAACFALVRPITWAKQGVITAFVATWIVTFVAGLVFFYIVMMSYAAGVPIPGRVILALVTNSAISAVFFVAALCLSGRDKQVNEVILGSTGP